MPISNTFYILGFTPWLSFHNKLNSCVTIHSFVRQSTSTTLFQHAAELWNCPCQKTLTIPGRGKIETNRYLLYTTCKIFVCAWSTSHYNFGGSVVKNPPAKAGDTGWILGLGRSPGEGHDNPLQYSCLENLTGIGAWRGRKESDMTWWMNSSSSTHSKLITGERSSSWWGHKRWTITLNPQHPWVLKTGTHTLSWADFFQDFGATILILLTPRRCRSFFRNDKKFFITGF